MSTPRSLISVKPIIKLALPAAGGFFLARANLLPVAGSRAASQIILNLTLPSLLFAKILPSFTQDNVKAIGPIFLMAFVYLGMSLFMGLAIRTFLPVPRNFRWGILAAAGWSNCELVVLISMVRTFIVEHKADLVWVIRFERG